MGIDRLSDKEIVSIMSTSNGLANAMKDPEVSARILGVDSLAKTRIAGILKYDVGLNKEDIRNRIGKLAYVHSSVTDFF